MDTYQAVYDAIRSKFCMPDMERIVRECFDISWTQEIIKQEMIIAQHEVQRPSVLMRPDVYPDGNMWCALYGDDLVRGVCGFGETPALAMRDFDKNWNERKINSGE